MTALQCWLVLQNELLHKCVFFSQFHIQLIQFYIAQDEAGRGTLEAFSTPAHSMAKVVMQTAGDLDYEIIFNEADLLYSPMAYLLFFFFVVLMPILFSNLLVSYV